MTGKTQEVLNFIIAYKRDHDGVGPSMSEIGAAVEVKSNSNVTLHLETLERAGLIECLRNDRGDRIPRGIKVTGGAWVFDNHNSDPANHELRTT